MNTRVFAAIGAVAAAAASVTAAPLNLTQAFPDIYSNFTSTSYNAASGAFTAEGWSSSLTTTGGFYDSIFGTFVLSATIDNDGNLVGGTIEITGSIAALGYNSGTLLTGNLTAFGFQTNGSQTFEFLFDVTGGDAASIFGPVGGVILHDTGFAGSFDASFNTQMLASSDTFTVQVVPLPTAGATGLAGLALVAARRRCA